MTRLIDADKIPNFAFSFTVDKESAKSGTLKTRVAFWEDIQKMPTVEARPQGEWIFKFDNSLIPTGYWECSECKKGRLLVETKFCPNCGADMGGEENDL